MKKTAILALMSCASLALGGCAAAQKSLIATASEAPQLAKVTSSQRDLIYLPPPPAPVPIAVYSFTDQTGQLKPSENIQSLSRAVTQGGTSILIKALRDAGNGNWFTVVERERLDNLLKERQIIREMRQRYLGEPETPSNVLPSLLFAGILLEGGIVGYDSNTQTGGLGARFLGIGGNMQWRQNTVTISLRAISVKTGEVLGNVTTTKTVASVAMNANVFKFVTFDELLEGEAGISANEPMQIATQAAIEKAVYALVLEGAQPGARQLWNFADKAAGDKLLTDYQAEKNRALSQAWRDAAPADRRRERQRKQARTVTPPTSTQTVRPATASADSANVPAKLARP